ncbi:histidinol dehydrogenase [Natronolimnohabitans sp. A-GB9]|uniref:histidinol dehydrogenase n=1 Tax=Natronolimnohabitans sp. A-GB9 TaxID=3069757 RepID=UPI0027B201D7|nr:histidinol dehydrogenase [Natronolimnohabitans sp. A-GB9]MDQ2052693.1 histidinol dehydrogenase [Natronolimnohabitans sp. A-GB9]
MSDTVEYLKEAGDASIEIDQEVVDSVHEILSEVKVHGDEALHEFTERFDGVEVDEFRVSDEEIEAAANELTAAEKETIENTIENVREFHEEQREQISGFEKEFEEGVKLGQRVVPVETAGTYVPGGRHPLVAAPAMSIVPAKVAGVERIITCAPPQEDGSIQPAQLYAMDTAGADEIYSIGGAQAIGAMAYGTESVPNVSKITGPGNVFTTEAKRQVFGHVGIDFLAGPSEVLILTDETSDTELVATDLLAQAEHDPNSRPILVSTDREVAKNAVEAFDEQATDLRTEDVARKCWENNGEVVVTDTIDAALEVVNDYAIEHLQVMIDEPRSVMDDLYNYGSLFLGDHSPVVFGDKAVGTNHSLPTLEVARYSGGITVNTYLKILTHQEATEEGAARIAPWAAKICELEGTHAHQLSAEARFREDISPAYGPQE